MSENRTIRIQSVRLKRESNQLLILWGSSEKEIPEEPPQPELLPEDEVGHWHKYEYAGWGVKKENIPESPRTGASGKKIIYLQPGDGFGYLDMYVATLQKVADRSSITLEVYDASWNEDKFDSNVDRAIQAKPDMILLNPEHDASSTIWYKRINESGIPVIGSNFLASSESHRYLLAWTGPDDWGQTRLLARHLADAMDRTGNYAILQHLEGNSSYYARTWGVISELKLYAPRMRCLDAVPGMDPEQADRVTRQWIEKYGSELRGIFSADDGDSMVKVAEVLAETGRDDIVCVAAGSSRQGIDLILQDRLIATAYQSPAVDGEIAMQTAVDWFDGVPLEPIRYLPKHIITREDAADFIDIEPNVDSVDLERLFRCVRDFDWIGSYHFYGDLYQKVIDSRVVTLENFQGLCLEILTGLIHILREDGLSVEETLGSYDRMVKHLFKDTDVSSVLDWLNQLSQQAISRRMEKLNRQTPVQEIIAYINENISSPISLKTLSHQFGISHAYLGQMFRKETGVKFNDYVNSMRVDKAKVMLKGKQVTINSVARELGYANPDYFYKIFRKLTGQSASEFIKDQR